MLLKYIDSVDEKIAFRSLYALNIFCENMEDAIFDYVGDIVPYLFKFLETKKDIML